MTERAVSRDNPTRAHGTSSKRSVPPLVVGTLAVAWAASCSSPADEPEPAGKAVAPQIAAPTTAPARAVQQGTVARYVVLEGPGAIASLPAGVDPTSPAGSKLVMARAAQLRAAHARLIPRLEAAGATVVADLVLVANLVQIRVAPRALAGIAALPGVARLETPTLVERTRHDSVPLTGAPTLWESGTPLTGQGMRIGILDSGIDYFHADLGGAGDPNAYSGDDHTIIEANSFPTTRVAGGTDLAGDDYDASGQNGNVTPAPDPDPIDCGGHGTHVAGIAAGQGVLTGGAAYTGPYNASLDPNNFDLSPGVAPEASLYAIKIFGCDGPTDLTLAGIEWATDPDGDTNPSDRLDVLNASLGSDYDTGASQAGHDAIAAYTAAGGLFVAAAGNGGGDDRAYFSAGFPASAPEALAVGATHKQAVYAERLVLEVTAPGSVAGSYPVGQADQSPTLADVGTVSGEIVTVLPENACEPLTNGSEVDGKIALVRRGQCPFILKGEHSADAGAIAMIWVDNSFGDFPMDPFASSGQGPGIPMFSLRKVDGDQLWDAAPLTASLTDGVTMEIWVGPDFPAIFTARGPTVAQGLLKPDLMAPGVAIRSTALGSGVDDGYMSGTSQAAPTAAGAAALLRQGLPGLGPLAIKARMVSTGVPVTNVYEAPFPASIAGAGRLQVDAALGATITARVDGLDGEAGVSFGSLRSSTAVTETRTVIVSNHDTVAATLDLALDPALEWPGTLVELSETSITVPAGGTATFTLSLTMDPAQVPPTPSYEGFTGVVSNTSATPGVGELPSIFLTEASGTVTLTHQGDTAVAARVAYHGVVQPAAERSAGAITGCYAEAGAGVATLALEGTAAPHGNATSVLELGTETSSYEDPTGPDAQCDILAVGHLSNTDTERVYFGVAVADDWVTPARSWRSEVGIEVDTDDDQVADYLVLAEAFVQPDSGDPQKTNHIAPLARVVRLSSGLKNADIHPLNSTIPAYPGGVFYDSDEPETWETHVHYNRVVVFPVALESLHLEPGSATFAYRGVSKVSRYPLVVGLPMEEPLDTTDWVSVDADHPRVVLPESHYGSPLYPEDDTLEMSISAAVAEPPTLLVLHHSNAADPHYETVDIPALEGSDLSVTAADGGDAIVGDTVTATFTVANSATGALSGVTVSLAATGGTITQVDASTGTCDTSSCDLGDLAASDTVTIDVTGEADEEGSFDVTATVASANGCDTDATNDEATESFAVAGAAPPAPTGSTDDDSGCGCRMAPSRGLAGWAAAAALVGLVGLRRRRRG